MSSGQLYLCDKAFLGTKSSAAIKEVKAVQKAWRFRLVIGLAVAAGEISSSSSWGAQREHGCETSDTNQNGFYRWNFREEQSFQPAFVRVQKPTALPENAGKCR